MPASAPSRESHMAFAHPYKLSISQHTNASTSSIVDESSDDDDMGERFDVLQEDVGKRKGKYQKKKKRRQGKRHRGQGVKRAQRRWQLHKTQIHEENEGITKRIPLPSSYHLFRSGQRTLEKVHIQLAEHFPAAPSDIPVASISSDEILVIQMTKSEAEADDHLPFSFDAMVVRLIKIFSRRSSDFIIHKWREFMATNPTLSPSKPRKQLNHLPWVTALQDRANSSDSRSATPAFHLGCWAKYAKVVRLTAESLQKKDEQNVAMDALLMAIKSHILDPICTIMQSLYPRMYLRAQNCHEYVREKLQKEFEQRPALDLGPIAFCVAIKDGGSEFPHLDFGDDPHHFSYVAALGENRTGGEWCAPQFGMKIPLERGQILAAKTAVIAHCTASFTGPRTAITMFTCKQLLKLADEWGATREARKSEWERQLRQFQIILKEQLVLAEEESDQDTQSE
ncbi:hypothetical protein DL96DRAFT_1632242 [Flagelloscypha sp. PMI_526]|nr:hypothetical protein DL96DRAFT_1632242 [Flagelloscypha sp. PMI_526]